MAPQRAGASRIGLVLVLLALVGLASTARLPTGTALSSLEVAVVLVLFAAAVMLAVIAVGVVGVGGGYAAFGGNRRRTNLIAALLMAAVIAALVAAVMALYAETPHPIEDPRGAQPSRGTPRQGESDTWAIGAALGAGGTLLALFIVGAAVVLLARRRTRPALTVAEEETIIAALDESLDDLRHERDVRRAIIACYARMERALERAGSARQPAEAPFEYLVRVLERITANAGAARVLTELFERAKFSIEPMGEREKQEAIGALELLRAEVSRPP